MVLKRHIEELTGKKFDLIIVGGGITGAAVAYIAAYLKKRIMEELLLQPHQSLFTAD
jgi:thioredoxin reductase